MRKTVRKYFIPERANEYKPHFLRSKTLLTLLIVASIIELSLLGFLFSSQIEGFKNSIASVLPSVLVLATNEERVERNLGMLNTNPQLVAAAQLKADDMAAREFFAHVNPDGEQPWVYLDRAGYKYDAAGENLAVNFIDSKDVHNAWMKSPTHRANIVQQKFTEIGIATARGTYEGEDVIFVVQFFGTPTVETGQVVAQETSLPVVQPVQSSPTPESEVDQNTVAVIVASTTQNNTAVLGAETDEVAVTSVSATAQVVSAPRTLSTYILMTIMGLVALTLLVAVLVRRDIQHPRMILGSALLLAILAVLLFFNQHYFIDVLGQIAGR